MERAISFRDNATCEIHKGKVFYKANRRAKIASILGTLKDILGTFNVAFGNFY